MRDIRSFANMLLLPYTPREDSAARGYETWLRDVDNPFFNSVPGIAHYTNWRVLIPHVAVPYTHFDFLGLEKPGADAVGEVWGNKDLAEFAAGWSTSWGRYPDANAEEMPANYHVYRCELVDGEMPAGERIVYAPCHARPDPLPEGYALWKVVDALVGDPRFEYLLLGPADQSSTNNAYQNPAASYGSAVGEIVAAPD